MADPQVPNFAAQVNPANFQVPGMDRIQQTGKDIQGQAQGVHFDWSGVNELLDKARQQANAYQHQAQTGEGVYQGQQTALGQEDLGKHAGIAPAAIGQALVKLSQGGAAQAGQVGAAQGQAQTEAAGRAVAEQDMIVKQRAAMMQAEMALQAKKQAINNSVAQVQQGLSLAQTHLTNMYNNAVASATNSTTYEQLTADQQTFQNVMSYIQSGLGMAAAGTAAGAAYVKSNPNSAFSTFVNPNSVWSSAAGYNSGQYASPTTYDPEVAANPPSDATSSYTPDTSEGAA